VTFNGILCQDFYTVHGVDANFVAREIFKSEGVLRYFGQGNFAFYVLKKFQSVLCVVDKVSSVLACSGKQPQIRQCSS